MVECLRPLFLPSTYCCMMFNVPGLSGEEYIYPLSSISVHFQDPYLAAAVVAMFSSADKLTENRRAILVTVLHISQFFTNLLNG